MKKEQIAIAMLGFGISQVALGLIARKKREKEFTASLHTAAENATNYMKRQMQSMNPYAKVGAFGVSAAMEDAKGTPE